MSVYCQITLPPAARLRDVATVLARIMFPLTPKGRALGIALVDFFGGTVEDDESEGTVYSVPARDDIHASDGETWDAFQRWMAAINPLTPSAAAYPAE